MLAYTLGGAAVGVLVGYLIPPGHFFWFVVGAISGCLFERYVSRR